VSKFLLEKGTLYFDSRSMFGRLATDGRKRFLWPSLRDAAGFKAMWRHFIDCLENERQPELSIETVFHDFAYLDAAYRSLESGQEESPESPPAGRKCS
jgi:predicted dehydrogenase